MSSPSNSLLIGTTKGAFVVSGDDDRRSWTVTGPCCEGSAINHVIGDLETGTICQRF